MISSLEINWAWKGAKSVSEEASVTKWHLSKTVREEGQEATQVCSREQHSGGWACARCVGSGKEAGVSGAQRVRETLEGSQRSNHAGPYRWFPHPPPCCLTWPLPSSGEFALISTCTVQLGTQFSATWTFPWWFCGSQSPLSSVRLWALQGQGRHTRLFLALSKNKLGGFP